MGDLTVGDFLGTQTSESVVPPRPKDYCVRQNRHRIVKQGSMIIYFYVFFPLWDTSLQDDKTVSVVLVCYNFLRRNCFKTFGNMFVHMRVLQETDQNILFN